MKKILFIIWYMSCILSCKKLVQVDSPYTSTNTENVFSTDASAASVLTGIYTQLSATRFISTSISGITYYGGLSADEFVLYAGVTDPTQKGCYQNMLNTQTAVVDIWSSIYPYIYKVNSAIEGLNSAPNLTPGVKQQLLGEAKFMRGFFYFYLVNFYGDVPLVVSSDYKQNSIVARTPMSQVYSQIIQDLKDAESLLGVNYLDATVTTTTTERTRPTKWAAAALLARVYLYTGDYQDAINEASEIIGNTGIFSLNTLAKAFTKNNSEAIWQWQPVTTGFNTFDANTLIISVTGPSATNPVRLSNSLLSAFEINDQRKVNWVGSVTVGGQTYYYPYKYKVKFNNAVTSTATMTEYPVILRLAEQYLIRAEANAQLGNIMGASGALSDLNVIRTRATLPAYAGAQDKASVLSAILHERQVELFSEWGHRWLDLKRTGNVDSVMGNVTPTKGGGAWKSYKQLFPIIQSQILLNTKLVQNSGY